MIRCRGDAQIDLHAAPRRQAHCRFQADIGHEVGGYGDHAFTGLKASVYQQGVHGIFGLVRSARQELSPTICGRSLECGDARCADAWRYDSRCDDTRCDEA